jgi:tetratricopeptide (TPR) repeat protein
MERVAEASFNMEWEILFMKKTALLLIVLGTSACSLLQVKISPDPFYSAVLQQEANNPAALYAQGERFIRQGRYAEALPYFERLSQSQPGNMRAWFELGRSYYEAKNYKQARSAFQKVWEGQPSEAALLGLAAATLMAGDAEEAGRFAARSEKQYGSSAALWQIKGDIAYFSVDPAAALKFYRQSLEKNPNQKELQERVKDLEEYLTMGR